MTDKQLPTLKPGDSHMESLIEAAIQGHASTRDGMRWLVRQLVPASQQAEVTDAELLDAYNSIDPCNESPQDRLIRRMRAILALRPAAVPMTEEQPDPYSPEPKRRMPPGRYIIRKNDDGEFGQATGWLYRDEGPNCIVSGAPVYVWRPLSDLLGQKPSPAPISVDVLVGMYDECPTSDGDMIAFARAIEAHHGITAQAKKEGV